MLMCRGFQRKPVRTHSRRAVQAVGRRECIPILRASSRWKPSRSATTKAHAIMIGARFTTVNFFTRTCTATRHHMLSYEWKLIMNTARRLHTA